MAFGETHYKVEERLYRRSSKLKTAYGGTWNTYYDHPTGYGLDSTSVDHWGPGGRGAPVSEARGQRIFMAIQRFAPTLPYRWLIWNGYIYYGNGTSETYDGLGGPHKDHVHVTYESTL